MKRLLCWLRGHRWSSKSWPVEIGGRMYVSTPCKRCEVAMVTEVMSSTAVIDAIFFSSGGTRGDVGDWLEQQMEGE